MRSAGDGGGQFVNRRRKFESFIGRDATVKIKSQAEGRIAVEGEGGEGQGRGRVRANGWPSGRRRTVSGRRRTVSGRRRTVYGRRRTVYGRRRAVSDRGRGGYLLEKFGDGTRGFVGIERGG